MVLPATPRLASSSHYTFPPPPFSGEPKAFQAPSPKATVLELTCDKTTELISPEDDSGVQYWLDALRQRLPGGGMMSSGSSSSIVSMN